jgi:hypothetical protein
MLRSRSSMGRVAPVEVAEAADSDLWPELAIETPPIEIQP